MTVSGHRDVAEGNGMRDEGCSEAGAHHGDPTQ